MPTWLIWLIVIVVVVLVVGAIVSMAMRRRTAARQQQAEELRTQASTQAATLPETHRQREELRAKADLARAEADRAQEQAERAQRAHDVEQASYEDKVREADRLDPHVNTRSGDYQPEVPATESGAPADTSPSTPRHATTPDDATVAQRTEDPEAAGTSSTTESDPNRSRP
jgi:FtsZ-interacting cell division protein ZipA